MKLLLFYVFKETNLMSEKEHVMRDDRIQLNCTNLGFCKYCIPLLRNSLKESNIGTRCSQGEHLDSLQIHLDPKVDIVNMKFMWWKWADKIKVSNDDRRTILRKICDFV